MDSAKAPTPDDSGTTSGQIDIARTLVRRLAKYSSAGASPGSDPNRGVLLDLEVDGVRCLLVRGAQNANAHRLLSPRELEIARMVAKGRPNKAIGAELEISAWTVNTHIRRIFGKLRVGTRAAMVARLAADGLIAEIPGASPSGATT